MSKCPKCESTFTHVNLAVLNGRIGMNAFKCVSYNCPHCDTSLNVVTDPVAVRSDVVAQVTEALRKMR